MTISVTIGGGGGSGVVATLVDSIAAPTELDERIYAVNVGGPVVGAWETDAAYVDAGSNAFAHPDSLLIDTSTVSDPAPAAVYRSERVAPVTSSAVTLRFRVEGDHHLVRVHLAENWAPSMMVGGRVHTVEAAVGAVSESDPTVDVYARSGAGQRAYVVELDVVGAGTELVVTVAFVSGDRPRLQGIEIYAAAPLGPAPTPLAELFYSLAADRSNPVALHGATITAEPYYIFATSDETAVDFYLDDVLERSDSAAPFDLEGDSGGDAIASNFADGAYTVQVRVGSTVLASATFTIDNDVIVPGEEYPANPDVVLNPGATQAQIDNALSVSGNIVQFNAGSYGDRQIAPAMNVHAFCTTPYGASFQASAHSIKPWVTGGGSSVRLDGFKVDRYSANNSQNDAAIPVPAGGWEIDRCEIMAARNAGIRLSNNTLVQRALIHDCGRYAWAAGNNSTVLDTEVWRMCISDGTELVPKADNSDRGVCKMAGGSDGNHIENFYGHQIRSGKGIWWDGARTGSAKNLRLEDIDHNAVSVEVCWGGAEEAPSGKTVTWPDPAFTIEGVEVVNQHNENQTSTAQPAPAGVLVSMSPGVWVSDMSITNVGGAGIGNIYGASHNVFDNGFPAQNISAAWAQSWLKNHNIHFSDFTLDGSTKRYTAGAQSGFDGAVGTIRAPLFESGGTPSSRYSMSIERFCWQSSTNLDLADWLALGHS